MKEESESVYEETEELDEDISMVGPSTRLEEFLLNSTRLMCGNQEKGWIDRTLVELRHLLLDAGICCIELKLVLEKVRYDLEQNVGSIRHDTAASIHFDSLLPKEKYIAITPGYMNQLFDESMNNELIGVWIDQMLVGEMILPGRLPNILGQLVSHKHKEWANAHLDPSTAEGDIRRNYDLRYEVFNLVGLI